MMYRRRLMQKEFEAIMPEYPTAPSNYAILKALKSDGACKVNFGKLLGQEYSQYKIEIYNVKFQNTGKNQFWFSSASWSSAPAIALITTSNSKYMTPYKKGAYGIVPNYNVNYNIDVYVELEQVGITYYLRINGKPVKATSTVPLDYTSLFTLFDTVDGSLANCEIGRVIIYDTSTTEPTKLADIIPVETPTGLGYWEAETNKTYYNSGSGIFTAVPLEE